MEDDKQSADVIFEVSWEVCNKVGGIHTVISSKSIAAMQVWEDKLIMIGPDIWKGTTGHPEFEEDEELFADWRNHAATLGILARTGRWKIPGNPPVILVDFTPFFAQKNDVFAHLWTRFQLDSLTGGWDYAEPAMFGYAAGKVIESFYHFYLTYSDRMVAHFHEWMTGVGLLYLEEHVPQAATVFTTHATVLGRSIAGNGLPLYENLAQFDASQEARKFNVLAKHSLEKCAARLADCFTTVSEITGKECLAFLGKAPDMITPNGFDTGIVPDYFLFQEKRMMARRCLLDVASAMKGRVFGDNALLLLKSGRYEFHNKGIDAFIESLALLKNQHQGRDIVAFIFIPAGHTGYRKDLRGVLTGQVDHIAGNRLFTHNLMDAGHDAIATAIENAGLQGGEDGKVHVVYSPVYLNGQDGIYHLSYYDLLPGFDLTVFPSYYEPWGYTPQESVAFHVPTITTDNAGFGDFLLANMPMNDIRHGAAVVIRGEKSVGEVSQDIAAVAITFASLTAEQVKMARVSAHALSGKTLWKHLLQNYISAYSRALQKTQTRQTSFSHEATVHAFSVGGIKGPVRMPRWRKIFVETRLPASLVPLEEIMKNFWWTWNPETSALFQYMDPDAWEQSAHNPLNMLEHLGADRLSELEGDKQFKAHLGRVYKNFTAYMQNPMKPGPVVAYFCSEYGIYSGLEQYSGGLGILAGDLLKQASDDGCPLVGVGLLYRYGYFKQEVSLHGEQIAGLEAQKFTCQPLHPVYDAQGNWLRVNIALPGRTLYAQVRRADVGRTRLFLLDTDIAENRPEDRKVTGQLYGGDRELRLKQEMLLGIGGMRLLQSLEISPDVFHFNEGHVAFASLERIRMLMYDENMSFEEALEWVRSTTIFTTHTPVPAGHEIFSEELLRRYLGHFAPLLNISWEHLMQLGNWPNHARSGQDFSMSLLAANTSIRMNAVSRKHERVSRHMFSGLWEGYGEDELFIDHVTNGVHIPTWVDDMWQRTEWDNLSSEEIFSNHLLLKKRLIQELKMRFSHAHAKDNRYYKRYAGLFQPMDEKTLIISFARRFVAYKRPGLLFFDQDRLLKIMNNARVPVVFLFAGKAHPFDFAGQEEIRHLLNLSVSPEFRGKLYFLANYDIELAQYLVKGSDLWLNLPRDGMEASGTSGMKAAMNGVLNLSTDDGWWAEAENMDCGWTISHHVSEKNGEDEWDSERLYELLERQVIPAYEDAVLYGKPDSWVAKMRNAIKHVRINFDAGRMLSDYQQKMYLPVHERKQLLIQNDRESLRDIAAWKQKVEQAWSGLSVIQTQWHDTANKAMPLGESMCPKITLKLNGLKTDELGVEMLVISKRKQTTEPFSVLKCTALSGVISGEDEGTWTGEVRMQKPGVYEYGFRIYPKHPLLAHRQDFALIKWV
ncbi:MAG: alpha-glucan family phosphorylase [Sphingomonadales bacterium]|jgi:phosphorylase/glycogen(starch) synthase